MDQLESLYTLLAVVILAGGAGRIVYCFIMIAMGSEEEQSYKSRARNVAVFVVLAEGIVKLLDLIAKYF